MKKRCKGLLALLLAAVIVICGMPAIGIEAEGTDPTDPYYVAPEPSGSTYVPYYPDTSVTVSAPEQGINPQQQTIGLGASFNYNIDNKVYGCTYNWYVEDESVVTINPKNGIVTAQGVGESKVYVDITFPDGTVKTLEAIATVKKWVDAEEVIISNPAVLMGIGEMYNFNREMDPISSNNKTYWIVMDEDGNIIANTRTGFGSDIMTSRGFFTTPAAGTYTIIAQCWRSKTATVLRAESEPLTVIAEE